MRNELIFILMSLDALWTVSPVQACAVCFGDPESSLTGGLRVGILTLLAMLAVVFGFLLRFFLQVKNREKNLSHQ